MLVYYQKKLTNSKITQLLSQFGYYSIELLILLTVLSWRYAMSIFKRFIKRT